MTARTKGKRKTLLTALSGSTLSTAHAVCRTSRSPNFPRNALLPLLAFCDDIFGTSRRSPLLQLHHFRAGQTHECNRRLAATLPFRVLSSLRTWPPCISDTEGSDTSHTSYFWNGHEAARGRPPQPDGPIPAAEFATRTTRASSLTGICAREAIARHRQRRGRAIWRWRGPRRGSG